MQHRRQGMRVGAAFSAALDPSRPPLFSDTDTALLPEEVWHRSASGEPDTLDYTLNYCSVSHRTL